MDKGIRCTACDVWVKGSEERREHYRSDLHRVNVKRKVGGLGPLTEAEVLERLQALREEGEDRKEGKKDRNKKEVCEICEKKFSSAKALENHRRSRGHGEGYSEIEEDAMEEELEERMRQWKGGELYSGIFDKCWFRGAEQALTHAKTVHGLFVPYEEHVLDWEGLVRYMGEKVGVGYICLCCDRGFACVEDVRRHMKDVGHGRMGDDWLEEYGEFYGLAAEEGEDEDEDAGDGDLVGLVVGNKVLGHRSFNRYYRQAAGASTDTRVAVVANRHALTQLRTAWKAVDKRAVRDERMHLRRRQTFQLVVGGKNYYTRKAKFKQKMAVFNSGYRA